MTAYYQLILDEVKGFVKKLSSKFTKIFESEIEEIRRFYVEQLYMASQLLFERIGNELTGDKGTISLFFGEEMGEVDQIGVI
jgi:hypothetical protein